MESTARPSISHYAGLELSATNPPESVEPRPLSYGDNTKRATAMVTYFKDRYFRDDIHQSINRLVRNYEIRASHFQPSNKEKALYFVNALEAPARDFFSDNCPVSLSYPETVSIIKQEYDSSTRRSTF